MVSSEVSASRYVLPEKAGESHPDGNSGKYKNSNTELSLHLTPGIQQFTAYSRHLVVAVGRPSHFEGKLVISPCYRAPECPGMINFEHLEFRTSPVSHLLSLSLLLLSLLYHSTETEYHCNHNRPYICVYVHIYEHMCVYVCLCMCIYLYVYVYA